MRNASDICKAAFRVGGRQHKAVGLASSAWESGFDGGGVGAWGDGGRLTKVQMEVIHGDICSW